MAAYERVTLNRGDRNSRFDCIVFSVIKPLNMLMSCGITVRNTRQMN